MVSCITCNSDAAGFIRHNKLLLYIFFPLLLYYYQMMQFIPLPEMTTIVTTSAQIPSKFFIPLVWFGLIFSFDILQNHWFAYGFSQRSRGNSLFCRSECAYKWLSSMAANGKFKCRCMYVWVDGSADGYFLNIPLFPCNVSLVRHCVAFCGHKMEC